MKKNKHFFINKKLVQLKDPIIMYQKVGSDEVILAKEPPSFDNEWIVLGKYPAYKNL